MLLIAFGTFLGFILIQYLLEIGRWHDAYAWFARRYGDAAARRIESPIVGNLVASAANFLAVSVGASLLVVRGRRWMFALPALCAVFLPWFAARLGVFSAYPLGQGWQTIPGPWGPGRFWIGASIDLGLALAPAIALLSLGSRSTEVRSVSSDVGVQLKIAALGFCLYLVSIDTWVRATLGQSATWHEEYALWGIVVPTCLFGMLIGLRHPRWLLALVLIPVFAWWELTQFGFEDGQLHLWPTLGHLEQALPLVGLTLLAAAWEPLSHGLASLRRSTITMLVILNVLNLADAFLTAFALQSEQAIEANPLIRVIGLPGKVLLVAVAGWMIARVRPNALIWPTIALGAILVWHVAGYVVSSHLL